jgi:hypothetical protein
MKHTVASSWRKDIILVTFNSNVYEFTYEDTLKIEKYYEVYIVSAVSASLIASS